MRRNLLGLFVFGALVATAGAARAQAPAYTGTGSGTGGNTYNGNDGAAQTAVPATLVATATINSIFNFTVVTGTLDCGTVKAGDSACAVGYTPAHVQVNANAPWTLDLLDLSPTGVANWHGSNFTAVAGSSAVTFYNNDEWLPAKNRAGTFTLTLTESTSSSCAVAAPNGLPTNGSPYDVYICPTTIAGLDTGDDFGPYTGTFSATMNSAY